jgi:hypothetical protein
MMVGQEVGLVLLIITHRQEVLLLLFQEDSNHTKQQLHKETLEEQMVAISLVHFQVVVEVVHKTLVVMLQVLMFQEMEEMALKFLSQVLQFVTQEVEEERHTMLLL